MKRLNKHGVTLIAAIAIMLLVSVIGADMALLLGVSTRTSVDSFRSAQAFALTQAGLSWYMMRLAGISDWSTETNQTDVALGSGTFDITINSQTAATINFTVTGKITGTDGVTIQHTMTQAATKKPLGSKFALFWGNDDGNVTFNNVDISGDYWSRGTTAMQATASVTNGLAYRPDTEDITGAGAYTEVSVSSPYPSMPVLDVSYYTGLISDWNTRIDNVSAAVGSGDLVLSADVDWTGQTISQRDIDTNGYNISGSNFTVNCRDFKMTGDSIIYADNYTINCRDLTTSGTPQFNQSSGFTINMTRNMNTNGTVTINGSGYFVAVGNILLQSENADSGTLTIQPNGGSIFFLADDDLTVNSVPAQTDTPVDVSSGARMYSRGSGTGGLLTIRNDTTNIDGVLLVANRRVSAQDNANVINSTLFVSYPGDNSNNYLRVMDAGTSVGTLAAPCALISIGRNGTAMRITNNASVVGYVYQYDSANSGATDLNNCTITGAVIANQLGNDTKANVTITYNESAIPLIDSSSYYASKDDASWSGN